MSSPVHHDENLDIGFRYAPPWARERARDRRRLMPTEAANLDWPPPARRLGDGGRGGAEGLSSGDLAILQMQRQLTLDPEMVPQPPMMRWREPPRLWLRIAAVVAAAGAAAFAFMLLVSFPAMKRAPGEKAMAALSAPQIAVHGGKDDRLPASGVLPRLVTEDRHGLSDEPLPAGIRLYGDLTGVAVILTGLAPDTRLSAGRSAGGDSWRVAAEELPDLQVQPPPGFVGAMNVTVDIRLANDRIVDSQVVRLEWAGRTATPNTVATQARPATTGLAERTLRLAPDEMAMLVKRGEDSLKIGDLAAARLLLRRAAEAGSAGAAFALGTTYDPHVIQQLGAIGAIADAAQARAWYQKALDLGSPAASQRLEQLAQSAR
jgi:hypothetical protein